MKKRNLILSLACSIVLAICLVVFTVVTIVSVNGGGNNGNLSNVTDVSEVNKDRDGSELKPYIVYDVESFNQLVVGKYLDEDGKYIDYSKKDKKGAYVYPELAKGLHYELTSDIDFDGEDISIFNEGIAFNGHIDGKGYVLSNISIEVTEQNLSDYMYLGTDGYRAHIAMFGKLDFATIENLAIENINVTVENEVLEYLRDDVSFEKDNDDIMYELTTSLFAGLVWDSQLDVDVQGTINGFSYSHRENKTTVGTNAVGGIVAAAVDTDISNSTVSVSMDLEGKNYWVGAFAGKAYNVISNMVASQMNVDATYNQTIYVGGAYGYVCGVEINEADIQLIVKEKTKRVEDDSLALLESNNKLDETIINIAGIVSFIRADFDSQKAIIKNVNVDADVAIDGTYAGAFIEVMQPTTSSTAKTVFIENLSLTSNVDVLQASGFAFNILKAQITSKYAGNKAGYDIKILGNVRLNNKSFYMLRRGIQSTDFIGGQGYAGFTIMISKDLANKIDVAENVMKNLLLKNNRLEIVANEVD